MYEAIIIGGGFYGAAIAAYLARQRRFKRIMLVEREKTLLSRASFNNQARVHSGYHYPRSHTTAYRSQVNLPRFIRDWPQAVRQDFTKLYAIAQRNSKVTARQFARFCREIDANIRPADPALRALFHSRLIEEVFVVDEYVFDSTRLALWAQQELDACGIEIRLQTRVTAVSKTTGPRLRLTTRTVDGAEHELSAHYVFNRTYSALNQLKGDFPGIRTDLKQEITEVALLQVPDILKGLGITVMDGPFFSLMPFPAKGLHSLSHVRYTPHMEWHDQAGLDPYQRLDAYECVSRADRMMRDASRYLPALRSARHIESLFEVKTVLLKNEADDGRPILFEKHADIPGCYSVLGGKIDNIYDVLERLDSEQFIEFPDRHPTEFVTNNA